MPDTHGLLPFCQRMAQQLCRELGPPARLSDDYDGFLYVPIILGSSHVLGVFHSTLNRPGRPTPTLPYLGAISHYKPGVLHQWPLDQPDSIEAALAWARTAMGTS